MPTLYCPACGYNLTGLPDDRCSECGRPFDPQQLAAGAAGPWRPMTPWMAGLRCFALLAGTWMLALFFAASLSFWGLAALVVLVLAFLWLAVLNARDIAVRLAVRRAILEGHPGARSDFDPDRESPGYVSTLTAVFFVGTLLAGFGVPLLLRLLITRWYP